jgi:TonB family protein
MIRRVVSLALGVAACVVAWSGVVFAQDPLSLVSARALYSSAQYEEALGALNQMRASGLAGETVATVEQYRALCLLALGRASEAQEAIAAVIMAAPTYTPLDAEVSPRVRSTFNDVRRRVLPGIIQQRYQDAKAAYDRKDYVAAGSGFNWVLATLADESVAPFVSQPPLADLRMLAKGFHDLTVNALMASAPPPPPPAAAAPAPTTPAPSAAATAATAKTEGAPAPPPPAIDLRRIYTIADADVVAPAIVQQVLPPFPRRPVIPANGVVEVVINEKGEVETSVIRTPIDHSYDAIALAASRNWRYKPATRAGVPVKYRKLVQVKIQPTGRDE